MDGSRLGHKVGGKREKKRERKPDGCFIITIYYTSMLDWIVHYHIGLCCVVEAERVDRSGKQSNSRREGATGS